MRYSSVAFYSAMAISQCSCSVFMGDVSACQALQEGVSGRRVVGDGGHEGCNQSHQERD